MAIAHVCMGCGLDLARVRPGGGPEPHYGLRLIVCPRCSWACTRLAGGPQSRHPIVQGWRTYLRVQRSIAAMLGQIAIAAILLTLTLAATRHFGRLVRLDGVAAMFEEEARLGLIAVIILSIFTGTWLASCFPHWRAGLPWIAWAAVVMLAIVWQDVSRPAQWWLDARLEMHGRIAGGGAGGRPLRPLDEPAYELAMLAAIMVMSVAGVPLGRGVRISYARRRSRRWCRRRKQLRAQRLSR